ncbi:hypothetical protein C3L33_03772, partial [Rhododendron williamsianum]
MNKGGGGSGSGGGGPTASAAAAAAQKQKTLLQRVDNDIGNIVDNFSSLLTLRGYSYSLILSTYAYMLLVCYFVNDPPVRNSQEAFMMEMRAARMITDVIQTVVLLTEWYRELTQLLKLVSELKQTTIFSGFASLNDHVEQRIDEFNQQAEKTDRLLAKIGEEAAASLKELESHYYSSALRTSQLHQP